jgi:LPS export ABC transporter protein LptC
LRAISENKNALLINSFFFLALIVSIFAIKQLLKNNDTPITKDNPHTPDSYMVNVSYLRTNEQGTRDILVFSPFVTHYQTQDSSILKAPIIKLFKNEQQWIATSDEAKSYNGSLRFELLKNVKVCQLASKDKAQTTLLTESLTAYPKQNLVTTQDRVTIQQPGLTITGIGLKGDLKNGNIQLLSQTKGHYDPQKYH